MMRGLIRFVLGWGLFAGFITFLLYLVIHPPTWMRFEQGQTLVDVLPALLAVGALGFAAYKISQGYYFARLDVQVAAKAYPASQEGHVVLVISLRVANYGPRAVSVTGAEIEVFSPDGQSITLISRKKLGFGAVQTNSVLDRLLFGKRRDYRIVGSSQELRQVALTTSRHRHFAMESRIYVKTALTRTPGTWLCSSVLTLQKAIGESEFPKVVPLAPAEKEGDIEVEVLKRAAKAEG